MTNRKLKAMIKEQLAGIKYKKKTTALPDYIAKNF